MGITTTGIGIWMGVVREFETGDNICVDGHIRRMGRGYWASSGYTLIFGIISIIKLHLACALPVQSFYMPSQRRLPGLLIVLMLSKHPGLASRAVCYLPVLITEVTSSEEVVVPWKHFKQ